MSLDLRLRAYAPNGASLGLLPTPQESEASMVLGDVGAFRVGYPAEGPRASLLAGPCEVAIEVSYDGGMTWTEPPDGRFLRLRRSGDQVDKPRLDTYEGPGYVWRLTKAKVLRGGTMNADGKRAFLTANPGTIMRTLTTEAQARGALAGMDFSTFTSSNDSAGQPWAKVVTLYYEPGLDYLAVLMNLQAQGLVEFQMVGRSLRLYNGDTVLAGDSGASLVKGRDLTEAPFRGTLENLSDYAYLAGDNGVYLERTNPEASAPWGRWETYISQGGVSDTATMAVLSDATLALTQAERLERTYGLTFGAATSLPFRDYGLGEQVLVKAEGGVPESLRVRQITLGRDASGIVSGNAVLNDRFLENDVRQNRRISGITGGATLDGGSGARPNDRGDRSTPLAPSGLVVSSDAYTDDAGRVWAAVSADWAEVTTNTDGTACDDLAQYEVLWRNVGDTAWTLGATVDANTLTAQFGGLEPATDYEVGVRAVDSSLHRSVITSAPVTTSDDDVAPTTPSTPLVTVYLGQLLITWDGKNNVGGLPPVDFDRVEVHVGTSATFTPTAATLVDTITSPAGGSTVATDLTYDTAYYARLVAYDVRGNASGVSAAASGTPLRAADGDITSLTVNKITAGALSAAITVSGRIATALTGARVEMNSAGLKAYNTSGSLTVDIPSSGAGPTFVGTFRTAFSGARVELLASTGQAAIALYSGMASETAPGGLSTTVFGTGTAADAVITLTAPQKNNLDRANLQLRSRDADTGADVLFNYYNGSTYWAYDTGYGTHYFTEGGTLRGAFQFTAANGYVLNTGSDLAGPSISCNTHLELRPRNNGTSRVKVIGDFDVSNGLLQISDQLGAKRLFGNTDANGAFLQSENVYTRTATATANVAVNSAGTIFRATSLERYKLAIDRSWAEAVDLDAIKALNPATWIDRFNAERYAELVDPDSPDPADSPDYPRRLLGLVAEDVEALGLEPLLYRDDVGNLEGINYDRVAVALIPWLRDLERRVQALEAHAGTVGA